MAILWNPADTTAKKPHPFSKEAREARAAEAVETTQPKEPKATTPDLSAVLDRLTKLESENKELKDRFVPAAVKWQEIDWSPKQFKYKMRWGVPVISWTTKKIDNAKDLVFKNKFWQFESNHLLALQLADGTSIDVEVNEFGVHHMKSEYMVAKDQNGGLIYNETLPLATSFTFDTPDYGTFTLAKEFIN